MCHRVTRKGKKIGSGKTLGSPQTLWCPSGCLVGFTGGPMFLTSENHLNPSEETPDTPGYIIMVIIVCLVLVFEEC